MLTDGKNKHTAQFPERSLRSEDYTRGKALVCSNMVCAYQLKMIYKKRGSAGRFEVPKAEKQSRMADTTAINGCLKTKNGRQRHNKRCSCGMDLRASREYIGGKSAQVEMACGTRKMKRVSGQWALNNFGCA